MPKSLPFSEKDERGGGGGGGLMNLFRVSIIPVS